MGILDAADLDDPRLRGVFPICYHLGATTSRHSTASKSMLVGYLNRVIDTEHRFVCVSRPRRFGKSLPIVI